MGRSRDLNSLSFISLGEIEHDREEVEQMDDIVTRATFVHKDTYWSQQKIDERYEEHAYLRRSQNHIKILIHQCEAVLSSVIPDFLLSGFNFLYDLW